MRAVARYSAIFLPSISISNSATRAHFMPRTVFAASATAFSAALAKLSLEEPTISMTFWAMAASSHRAEVYRFPRAEVRSRGRSDEIHKTHTPWRFANQGSPTYYYQVLSKNSLGTIRSHRLAHVSPHLPEPFNTQGAAGTHASCRYPDNDEHLRQGHGEEQARGARQSRSSRIGVSGGLVPPYCPRAFLSR